MAAEREIEKAPGKGRPLSTKTYWEVEMNIPATTNQELARNTVIEGQLSAVLAESMLDDFWTLVPETMPPGFPDGLATHIEGWLRNVIQRGDERQLDYIVALCQALEPTGDLQLSPDGTAYRR